MEIATPLLKLLNYPLNNEIDSLPELPENLNLPDGKVVLLTELFTLDEPHRHNPNLVGTLHNKNANVPTGPTHFKWCNSRGGF
ncbi:MAG: hypothetical protein AB4080_05415 [Trichodesmium sp.]